MTQFEGEKVTVTAQKPGDEVCYPFIIIEPKDLSYEPWQLKEGWLAACANCVYNFYNGEVDTGEIRLCTGIVPNGAPGRQTILHLTGPSAQTFIKSHGPDAHPGIPRANCQFANPEDLELVKQQITRGVLIDALRPKNPGDSFVVKTNQQVTELSKPFSVSLRIFDVPNFHRTINFTDNPRSMQAYLEKAELDDLLSEEPVFSEDEATHTATLSQIYDQHRDNPLRRQNYHFWEVFESLDETSLQKELQNFLQCELIEALEALDDINNDDLALSQDRDNAYINLHAIAGMCHCAYEAFQISDTQRANRITLYILNRYLQNYQNEQRELMKPQDPYNRRPALESRISAIQRVLKLMQPAEQYVALSQEPPPQQKEHCRIFKDSDSGISNGQQRQERLQEERNIHQAFRESGAVCIYGPNRTGKTSLAQMVADRLEPSTIVYYTSLPGHTSQHIIKICEEELLQITKEGEVVIIIDESQRYNDEYWHPFQVWAQEKGIKTIFVAVHNDPSDSIPQHLGEIPTVRINGTVSDEETREYLQANFPDLPTDFLDFAVAQAGGHVAYTQLCAGIIQGYYQSNPANPTDSGSFFQFFEQAIENDGSSLFDSFQLFINKYPGNQIDNITTHPYGYIPRPSATLLYKRLRLNQPTTTQTPDTNMDQPAISKERNFFQRLFGGR